MRGFDYYTHYLCFLFVLILIRVYLMVLILILILTLFCGVIVSKKSDINHFELERTIYSIEQIAFVYPSKLILATLTNTFSCVTTCDLIQPLQVKPILVVSFQFATAPLC
jgi:hypothetical protein